MFISRERRVKSRWCHRGCGKCVFWDVSSSEEFIVNALVCRRCGVSYRSVADYEREEQELLE